MQKLIWLWAVLPTLALAAESRCGKRFRPTVIRLETRSLLSTITTSAIEHVDVTVRVQDAATGRPLIGAVTELNESYARTGVNGYSVQNTAVFGGYEARRNLDFYVQVPGYFTTHLEISVPITNGSFNYDRIVAEVPIQPFVTRFYQNIFGRAILDSEVSHYLATAARLGSGGLANQLMKSQEGIASRVRLFSENLNITPTAAESQAAERALSRGKSEDVAFAPLLRSQGIHPSELSLPSYLRQTTRSFFEYLIPGYTPTPAQLIAGKIALWNGGNESQEDLMLFILNQTAFVSSGN